MKANPNGEDLEEKKLLGSGGYAFAKLLLHKKYATTVTLKPQLEDNVKPSMQGTILPVY